MCGECGYDISQRKQEEEWELRRLGCFPNEPRDVNKIEEEKNAE